jgi:hypothetical protein
MSNEFDEYLRTAEGARLMMETAKRAAREVGLGPSQARHAAVVTNLTTASPPGLAAIRTTRDRWFGFVPKEGGVGWKTLDEVEHVLVCAVDNPKDPKALEVYFFSASSVRDALDKAYRARSAAGHSIRNDYGMWIALDFDDRDIPNAAGSGLAEGLEPVRTYPAEELRPQPSRSVAQSTETIAVPATSTTSQPAPKTIAEVLTSARRSIAELSGVSIESVRLDLKIEYSA